VLILTDAQEVELRSLLQMGQASGDWTKMVAIERLLNEPPGDLPIEEVLAALGWRSHVTAGRKNLVLDGSKPAPKEAG
jgi:hypothetical protein